jgi:hypothetical protein
MGSNQVDETFFYSTTYMCFKHKHKWNKGEGETMSESLGDKRFEFTNKSHVIAPLKDAIENLWETHM